jgi:NAD(P)-dependent dehydrogenase (short-subunit alcohol dehydrogenase family)
MSMTTALITGAAGGIGYELARQLAALRPRRPHFADAQFGSGGEPR